MRSLFFIWNIECISLILEISIVKLAFMIQGVRMRRTCPKDVHMHSA